MGAGVRRRICLTASVGLSVGALAMSCSPGEQAWVNVNDHRVMIRASSANVSEVLESAGVGARAGMVRSIVSGRPLAPNGNPPLLQIDGKPATMDSRLQARARLVTSDGADTIEEIAVRPRRGPFNPGAPAVETKLFHAGRARGEQVWVGKLSGEEVASLVTEPEVPAQPVTGKVVGLTFDDGPDPLWTPKVLDVLRREGVRATFCIIAREGRKHPDLVRSIVEQGHTLCNHTVDHAILPGKSADFIFGQLAGGSEFVDSITGSASELFRAPRGLTNPEVVRIAHSRDMRVLGWSIDSSDYLKSPPNVITDRVLSAMHRGAVVLLHDGGGDRANTVAALPPIISSLKSQGYSFGTPTHVP